MGREALFFRAEDFPFGEGSQASGIEEIGGDACLKGAEHAVNTPIFSKKEKALKSNACNRGLTTAVLVLLAAVVLLVVDQVIKYFVLRYLEPVGTVKVLPGLLEFTYVENTGAAFGLFQNVLWLVILVTLVASLVILVLLFRYRHHTFLSYATSALLLAGGVGNLLDRFIHGFVVDYIHVLFFDYIFNFADCCITVGAVLFVLHVLFFTQDHSGKAELPEEQEKL